MSLLEKLQNLPLKQRKMIVFGFGIAAMILFFIIKSQIKPSPKTKTEPKPRETGGGLMEMFLKSYQEEKEKKPGPPGLEAIPFFSQETSSQPGPSPDFETGFPSQPEGFEGLPEER